MIPQTNTTAAAERRLTELERKLFALEGKRTYLLKRNEQLEREIALAKANLEAGPEILSILDKLMEMAHERSVGFFEDLITFAIEQVMGYLKPCKIEVSVERGSPSLNMWLVNGSDLEDIMESNGGAVTNVVSTALRFSSLVRTKNRPLVVLDEPDCWIQPDSIPKFVGMLCDLTEHGFQTIMVSHHSPELFGERVNLIRLFEDAAGKTQVEYLTPDLMDWADESTVGLRSIELVAFKSHEHLKIQLGPGVNAIIGRNNLGKSNAFNAIRAVAYHESSSSSIKHGFDYAMVRIEVENNKVVEWKRSRKGSPAVVYRLYKNGTLVAEGKPESKTAPPAFVSEVLKIERVDDLDIQLVGQKSPVFLLLETPSKRAKILSVGKESAKLTALVEAYTADKRADTERVRSGEQELAFNQRLLSRLTEVPDLLFSFDMLKEHAQIIKSQEQSLVRSQTLENSWQNSLKIQSVCRVALAQAQNCLKELPELQPTERLDELAEKIELGIRLKPTLQLLRSHAFVEAEPELKETQRIHEIGVTWDRSSRFVKVVEPYIQQLRALLPNEPELKATDTVNRLGLKWKEAIELKTKASSELQAIDAETLTNEKHYDELLLQTGGQCPACGHALTEEHHAH